MLKLSQYLKIGGIIVGAIGGLFIVYAEVNVILEHPISLIVMGLGAAVWFAGAWEAKHEAQVAAAKVAPVVSSTSATVTVTPTA